MYDKYVSPLSERYASREMQYIFSPDKKFTTWRRLWIALAEAEHELGLPVSKEQIEEMKAHQNDINYEVARRAKKRCATTSCLMSTRMACSARRPKGSSIWARPPAMWATTRISLS